MRRKVVIAIPAYAGTVRVETMQAIDGDAQALRAQGIEVEIISRPGLALIALARALLVADFLAGDGTDLVFVDADVYGEPGALAKLVSHPVDFVAGVIPTRREPVEFTVNSLPYPVTWNGGLLEVGMVGAAFMRITRAALERMVAAYPESAFSLEGWGPKAQAPEGKAWALFDPVPGNPRYLGEDFSFCLRWRMIGGQVWVDPNVTLHHVGDRTFSGNFAEWLNEQRAA